MLSSERATRLKIFRVTASLRWTSARTSSRAAAAVGAGWAWAEDWSPGGCQMVSALTFPRVAALAKQSAAAAHHASVSQAGLGLAIRTLLEGRCQSTPDTQRLFDAVSPPLRLAQRPSRLGGVVFGFMGVLRKLRKLWCGH